MKRDTVQKLTSIALLSHLCSFPSMLIAWTLYSFRFPILMLIGAALTALSLGPNFYTREATQAVEDLDDAPWRVVIIAFLGWLAAGTLFACDYLMVSPQ